MSDTSPRNPVSAPQMLADALLRSVAGTSALLRVTGAATGTDQFEVGLVPTTFAEVVISPVLLRKLRPSWQEGGQSKWELLVSATGVQQQVIALDLVSAQALFAMTLAVTVAGQDYLIESVAANEAFGQVYLYHPDHSGSRQLLKVSGGLLGAGGDVHALGDESARDGQPDSPARSRDDRGLPVQVKIHDHPPSPDDAARGTQAA